MNQGWWFVPVWLGLKQLILILSFYTLCTWVQPFSIKHFWIYILLVSSKVKMKTQELKASDELVGNEVHHWIWYLFCKLMVGNARAILEIRNLHRASIQPAQSWPTIWKGRGKKGFPCWISYWSMSKREYTKRYIVYTFVNFVFGVFQIYINNSIVWIVKHKQKMVGSF